MTKEIQLTQGMVAIVDDEDYERVVKIKWRVYKKNGIYYAINANHRRYKRGGVSIIWLHRYILNPPPDKCVDHRDGDGLNCTRANMRICSSAENLLNRGKQSNNTSGYKGVYAIKRREKRYWVSEIMRSKKKTRIGLFKTPEDAARAYDKAAKEYHGEFARLNFPEE